MSVNFATASSEDLARLAQELTAEERQKLQKALQLLDRPAEDAEDPEDVQRAEEVVQCLKEEFQLDAEPRQTFQNGDRLFAAQAAQEEVRDQVGALEYLQFAEAKSGLPSLSIFARWSQANFPGFVKMWGVMVENREVPIKERKVLGVIYSGSETLENHLKSNSEIRNDHRLYLAMTTFQAWSHSLLVNPPCLPVFTMENVVVTKNEDQAIAQGYYSHRTQIRLQFPSDQYEEKMGVETLDTNVLQLADVLWFACHCDSDKLREMPRMPKPIDGEKVLKFSCRDFINSLYEHKSKNQTKPEKIAIKMQREYNIVREIFAD